MGRADCSFTLANLVQVVTGFGGAPVLGSRLGGIAELISGETGFLCAPKNADQLGGLLRRFAADPSAEIASPQHTAGRPPAMWRTYAQRYQRVLNTAR